MGTFVISNFFLNFPDAMYIEVFSQIDENSLKKFVGHGSTLVGT